MAFNCNIFCPCNGLTNFLNIGVGGPGGGAPCPDCNVVGSTRVNGNINNFTLDNIAHFIPNNNLEPTQTGPMVVNLCITSKCCNNTITFDPDDPYKLFRFYSLEDVLGANAIYPYKERGLSITAVGGNTIKLNECKQFNFQLIPNGAGEYEFFNDLANLVTPSGNYYIKDITSYTYLMNISCILDVCGTSDTIQFNMVVPYIDLYYIFTGGPPPNGRLGNFKDEAKKYVEDNGIFPTTRGDLDLAFDYEDDNYFYDIYKVSTTGTVGDGDYIMIGAFPLNGLPVNSTPKYTKSLFQYDRPIFEILFYYNLITLQDSFLLCANNATRPTLAYPTAWSGEPNLPNLTCAFATSVLPNTVYDGWGTITSFQDTDNYPIGYSECYCTGATAGPYNCSLWYKYTSPVYTNTYFNYLAILFNAASDCDTLMIQLYEAPCGSSMNLLLCETVLDSPNEDKENREFNYYNLVPGNDYYIRFTKNTPGNFKFNFILFDSNTQDHIPTFTINNPLPGDFTCM